MKNISVKKAVPLLFTALLFVATYAKGAAVDLGALVPADDAADHEVLPSDDSVDTSDLTGDSEDEFVDLDGLDSDVPLLDLRGSTSCGHVRSIVCTASDLRGTIAHAAGFNVVFVQRQAIGKCERQSRRGHCVLLGCRRF